MTQTVLFVDDEEDLRHAAAQTLSLADLPATMLPDATAALAHVTRDFDGVLVTDIRMPDRDGLWLMQAVHEIDPAFPVILVTGHGDVELAVRAMRDGAYDFVEKPYAPDALVATIRRALEKRRLTLENRALKTEVAGDDAIEARLVGRTPAMVALRKQVATIALTEADVLIIGETGTGKDLTARVIHDLSDRAAHPFVHINCAALPEHLVESELFGHEAGAFAGAMRSRFGRFEHARRGTVFLDEIDSLPVAAQAKLLHAVQDRRISRLGSNEIIDLDIRVIAAAKSDLSAAVAEGRFRSDLFYRLNVVTLQIPPLAQRRDDIPALFAHLAAQAAARYNLPAPDLTADIIHDLATRDWQGNVRELRNAADRFVLGLDTGPAPAHPATGASLAEQVASFERTLISATLDAHGGSMKKTYESLGLSRRSLYEKIQKYRITKATGAD